jgi:hypothetical protein
MVLRKKFVLSIKSWFSTFIHFYFAHGSAWYHLQCDCYGLNMKFLIFFKKFYKVHSVEVSSQDTSRKVVLEHQATIAKLGALGTPFLLVRSPSTKNNSSSLIITIMELRFEPCVFNLIWKWGAKDLEKRGDHLIFINFGVMKFTLKNTQKNKTLMFECYNLLAPMEWGATIFWGWSTTR